MRFCSLCFAAIASIVPAMAIPVTYAVAFTGGPFENGVQVNFAPVSGSFTFDPTTGFSNFLVSYGGDVFDFTAAANAPKICSSSSSCAPGTALQEFQGLFQHQSWIDSENSSNTFGVSGISTLSLGDFHDQISATAPGFKNFTATSPPAVGTFTIAAVPEPRSLQALLALALALLGWRSARRRAPKLGYHEFS